MSEYFYNRPAVSPSEAVMLPAIEPEEGTMPAMARETEAVEGMQPALPRTAQMPAEQEHWAQLTAREQGEPLRVPSQLRQKIRQSAQASDRMRGAQVRWMNTEIPVHTQQNPSAQAMWNQRQAQPQRQGTNPRLATRVKAREETNVAAPMQGVLQGAVKRMMAQDLERRPMTAYRAVNGSQSRTNASPAPAQPRAMVPEPVGAGQTL